MKLKKVLFSFIVSFLLIFGSVSGVSAASGSGGDSNYPPFFTSSEAYQLYLSDLNSHTFYPQFQELLDACPSGYTPVFCHLVNTSFRLYAVSNVNDLQVDIISSHLRFRLLNYVRVSTPISSSNTSYNNGPDYFSPKDTFYIFPFASVPPSYEPEHTYNPFGFDIQDFTEWLQLHPEFKVSLQKNFPWLKFDSADDVYKFLQWWDAYGQSAEEMERHVDELINHNMIYPDADVRFSADMLGSLSTQTLKQYYKYQESLKPKDQFVPDPVPPSVITDPSISVPNPSDPLDTSLIREIIRLLVLQINNDSSYYTGLVNAINSINLNLNNTTPLITNINNLLGGGAAGAAGGIAGMINNINTNLGDLNVKLGDYIDNLPSVPSVTDEEFWRMMLIPDFHDFDEFQDQFIEKFPVITQLDTLPDPDQILIGSGSAVQLASASSDDYVADEQFSFTAPETFANGAFTNIDIPIVDFSKFSLAIAAFKGIISVFALSIFSKWLFNFAPSLLNGR